MGKTRGQIKQDVQDNLSDYVTNFFSQDDLNNSIQDAYTDIAILTQCIQKSISVSWFSNLSYYNFAQFGINDYLGTIGIFNNVTNLWLRDDLSLKDFDRIRRDWETWNGAPLFWAPSDPNNIAVCPKYLGTVPNTWTVSSTVPDGIQTSFMFTSVPVIVSFNGLNQFLNSQYTISMVPGGFSITLIDVNGNVITPSVGDDIRGYLNTSILGSFLLFYWAQAPVLSLDTDTFLIASDMDSLITQYVTADMLEELEEFNKAQAYWQQYEENIVNYADRVKRIPKSDLLLRL